MTRLVVLTSVFLLSCSASPPDDAWLLHTKFKGYSYTDWRKPGEKMGLFTSVMRMERALSDCEAQAYASAPSSSDANFQRDAVRAMTHKCMRDAGWQPRRVTISAHQECVAHYGRSALSDQAGPSDAAAAAELAKKKCAPLAEGHSQR